ncbi:MAG: hypothetical protein KUG81_09330 [Gammaproteobacteria bacterium]|nr:hypothetical protein [Gammaproteobacteria bacterium]
MNTKIKTILPCLALGLLTGCVTSLDASQWHATHHMDEFTEVKSCRVQFGTAKQRSFNRSLFGQYITYNFYAENYDGEVRAGVRTEPHIPIAGDVQIKVGEKLYTLTSQNAPVDLAPTVSINSDVIAKTMGKDYAKTIEDITRNAMGAASPYRAYTGKKAKALLRDVVSATGEIKFRTVGINTATSATGKFMAGEDFTAALQECGINL